MTLQLADTHRSIKNLVATGLTEQQAEAIVATIGNIDYTVVATKFDLAGFREAVMGEMSDVRGGIAELSASVDRKIDGLKIWFLGAMLTQTLALVALILTVQGWSGP